MAKSQMRGGYKDTGILTISMGGVICGSWAPLLAVFVYLGYQGLNLVLSYAKHAL